MPAVLPHIALTDARDPFRAHQRECMVRSTRLRIADIEVLMGRTNRLPIRFPIHIALPETILLMCVDKMVPGADGYYVGECRFAVRDERGVCEDGVIRHVGFNRFRRAGVWMRLHDATGQPPYRYAEDVRRTVGGVEVAGFALLWQLAAKELNP